MIVPNSAVWLLRNGSIIEFNGHETREIMRTSDPLFNLSIERMWVDEQQRIVEWSIPMNPTSWIEPKKRCKPRPVISDDERARRTKQKKNAKKQRIRNK